MEKESRTKPLYKRIILIASLIAEFGTLRLQKFLQNLLVFSFRGKEKRDKSGRFLELFRHVPTEQKFTILTVHLRSFDFPGRCHLSLAFMFAPSSQERASKNIERTLLGVCVVFLVWRKSCFAFIDSARNCSWWVFAENSAQSMLGYKTWGTLKAFYLVLYVRISIIC